MLAPFYPFFACLLTSQPNSIFSWLISMWRNKMRGSLNDTPIYKTLQIYITLYKNYVGVYQAKYVLLDLCVL